MIQRFQRLLQQVVANPYHPIGQYELLTPGERGDVLAGWNDTARPVPAKTLPGLMEDRAAATPEAVAVVYDGAEFSYGDLHQRANRLARLLAGQGAGPERFVALAVPRSFDLIVALLAVLKTGAGYLPVDPSYPADRIAYMLADAQPDLLLTTTGTAPCLPPAAVTGARLVMLDDADLISDLARYPAHNLGRAEWLNPAHAAYMIYTSGSTGSPKGVVVPHAGIANRLAWMQARYQLRASDRVLQKTPSTFDVSVWEFFWPLIEGAVLVVAHADGHRDPAYLARLIRSQEVTTAHFVPSFLELFLAEPAAAECVSLRQVFCSGEELPVPVQDRFFEVLPGTRLHNLYGPTEASVDVTSWECHAGPHTMRVPIGKPIWNTSVYVLDASLRPVPPRVPGELYLAGVQLARGYLNRAGLTAQRFVANPYGPPGSRMYRTGDLACWRGDGAIEFLGRVDGQVKIRGQRVELGEIEAVLLGHPLLAQAAVVLRTDQRGTAQLVAYVVANAGEPAPAELRAFLAAALPAFMVPSAFVVLGQLPLMPNGKLDRGSLPQQDFSVIAGSGAPRSPREEILCQLFAEILSLDRVGINDNFFEIGGHSLLIPRLLSRIREELGISLPVRVLFEKPTVAMLAGAATERPGGRTVPRLDLTAEIVLDPMISDGHAQRADLAAATEPACVLLTGATGFLGAFLLRELLDRTQAEVCCLVRARSEALAAQRLRQVLVSYRLWDPALRSRIVAVPGDLEQASLGLGEEEFGHLAARVDAIYHNGARVNHVEPYARLRAANVAGTKEVLRLAATRRVKPVHYISTVGTALAQGGNPEVIAESRQLGASQVAHSGYIESKWVAEQLIRLAAQRGIPVTIYRPSRVWGHTGTGACGTNDALWIFVRAVIMIGAVPGRVTGESATGDPWTSEDIIPVDYVARTVVYLSRRLESFGLTHHLTSPAPTAVAWIFGALRHAGYQLESLGYAQWRRRLGAAADRAATSDGALTAAMLLSSPDSRSAAAARFDASNTQRGLTGSGITCPVIDGNLIAKYIRYLAGSGVLPPASTDPADGMPSSWEGPSHDESVRG